MYDDDVAMRRQFRFFCCAHKKGEEARPPGAQKGKPKAWGCRHAPAVDTIYSQWQSTAKQRGKTPRSAPAFGGYFWRAPANGLRLFEFVQFASQATAILRVCLALLKMRLMMTSKGVWYCSCNPPSHK
jgi:hypothetical protein